MNRIDRSSPVPLYHQLKETLRKAIENGTYPEGSALLPETKLEEMFNVSRITVRRAIQELVAEGLLTTERGKGTFVRRQKVRQELNVISSWQETMAARGLRTETKNVTMAVVPAPASVAKHMGLDATASVIKVERLRYAEGEPVTLMLNYIRPELVPGLSEEDLEGSLYETLETKYGITLAHAREVVEAKAAGAVEARLLGIRRGAPLLHVTRVTYGPDDRVVEVVMASSRADRYSYSVDLHGRPRQ